MAIEDKSSAQADGIDNAIPLVLDAVDSITADGLQSGFTLSDTGCADGGTSLAMVRSAIERVRQSEPGLPVSVIYTDQPRNDFNALVRNIHGPGPFTTYLDEFENVFPMFSGTSFYREILPPGTLHLGFSATAMRWLSAKPGEFSTASTWSGQPGRNWTNFARMRTRTGAQPNLSCAIARDYWCDMRVDP